MAKPPPKPAKPASRSARLAEALRANLKRRKAQARSRADAKATSDQTRSRD
jgi:hypothetical protein